jgi:pantetheine-phosphate adenylyltransferase
MEKIAHEQPKKTERQRVKDERGKQSMSKEEQHGHIAVYPGSFDPLTNGHLDIARRAANIFETLVIAVFASPAKNLLFSGEERQALWHDVLQTEGLPRLQVVTFQGLAVDYARSIGATVLIKGLRTGSDFEAERQQGLMNARMAPEIETICLFSNRAHVDISSSLSKEIARLGGNVNDLLPATVVRALQQKFATSTR